MFNVCIEQVILQRVLAAVKLLCPVITLSVDEEGISMQALDVCRAQVTKLEMQPECFKSFTCNSPCDVSFKVVSLQDLLTGEATSEVQLAKDDTNFLHVNTVLQKDEDLTDVVRGRVPLVDMPSDPLEFPDEIDGADIVRMNAKTLAKEINLCKQMGHPTVCFEVSRNSLTIEAAGNTKFRKTFHRGETADVDIRCYSNVRQEYSVQYLHKFFKAAALSRTVRIQISSTQPSNFEFRICNSKGDPVDGKLVFQLSPCVS